MIAMVIASIAMTILLHPVGDLDTWVEEWATDTRLGFTVEQLADYTDMAARHPGYFGRPVPHTHRPRRSWSGSVEQWRPLVERYFRPGDVSTAMRIMACESEGDPWAYHSGSGASGLMQHLRRYWVVRSANAGWAGADIFDPEANVAVAAWLRDAGGWDDWVCY